MFKKEIIAPIIIVIVCTLLCILSKKILYKILKKVSKKVDGKQKTIFNLIDNVTKFIIIILGILTIVSLAKKK